MGIAWYIFMLNSLDSQLLLYLYLSCNKCKTIKMTIGICLYNSSTTVRFNVAVAKLNGIHQVVVLIDRLNRSPIDRSCQIVNDPVLLLRSNGYPA